MSAQYGCRWGLRRLMLPLLLLLPRLPASVSSCSPALPSLPPWLPPLPSPLPSRSGFAFVDFSTKQEARNAMEAVQGAHLYGRRLLLEWAEEEGGLDELRAKTGARLSMPALNACRRLTRSRSGCA